MPTHQDETVLQRYAREHQGYLAQCCSLSPEQVAELQLQLHNALAREAALQHLLNIADQRVDDAADLMRRALAAIEGCGWKDLETDIAAYLAHQSAPAAKVKFNCVINGGNCGTGGYCDACPHVAKGSQKTCIECGEPYCHGACVELGDDDEDYLSRAIHDGDQP